METCSAQTKFSGIWVNCITVGREMDIENNFDKLPMKVKNATKIVAERGKKRFCCWVKQGSDVTDTAVSVGGTWQ